MIHGVLLVLLGAVFLAVTAWDASAQDSIGSDFVTQINNKRASGITCSGGIYQDPQTDQMVTFPLTAMPQVPPLTRNAQLDAAAAKAANEAWDTWYSGSSLGSLLAPTGYLQWISRASYGYYYGNPSYGPDANVTAVGRGPSCADLLSDLYTEIGFSTGPVAADGSYRFAYILAKPFLPAEIVQYRQAVLDAINARRAAGTTRCPIEEKTPINPTPKLAATPMPVKPPLRLDDSLSNFAQAHSDDMATWPYSGKTDPHASSNGQSWQIRRNSCNPGLSENVATNATSPAAVVEGWIGLSPGHCRNLFADGPFAGVGIAQATPLVQSGAFPFATLDIGPLPCGTTPAGPVTPPTQPPSSTLQPQPQPVGPAVALDPKSRYRIYAANAAFVTSGRKLVLGTVQMTPQERTAMRQQRPDIFGMFERTDDPVLLIEWGKEPALERHVWWNATPVNGSPYPGLQALMTDASCAKKLTVSRTYPPVFMALPQQAAVMQDQFWRITAVPGTDLVQIAVLQFGQPIYLAAEASGLVSWINSPVTGDTRTFWRLETVETSDKAFCP